MKELRLVAVSEDGSYAILAVPGRGGRFSLPIDDRLRTVARGQFSRLAQYEIEVENPLRPKEIQDRIRAGETAEEIADAAGIPIERVRRFEGPVLAEREYRAQEALRATVRGHSEPGPGPRLGDVVTERLSAAGASVDDMRWYSRKRADGNWQVSLRYAIAGRDQMAEWVFDPRRRHVTPADDQAVQLCLPEADWPAARFVTRGSPATATVTPIGSRLGGHAQESRAEPERPAPRGPEPAATGSPADQQQAAAGLAGQARPAPAAPAAARPEEPAEEADEAEDRPAAAAAAAGPPARKAAGGRSRRSSVPSWDEIMFGTSRQSD